KFCVFWPKTDVFGVREFPPAFLPVIRRYSSLIQKTFRPNRPTESFTCNVLIPGFGTERPALEMWMYFRATPTYRLDPELVGMCSPIPACGVKLTLFVPSGTSWVVKRTPPPSSRY